MSFTLPSRTPSGPRRRSLLLGAAGAGTALLAGCSARDSSSETTQGSPSAADRARARAARDSERLAERYEAVLSAHPTLAGRLAPLRAEVVRHARAFGGGERVSGSAAAAAGTSADPSAPPSPSTSLSPTLTPSASPSTDVPTGEKDALKELASAERALADRRTKALMDVPGEQARLLASVAAAGAVHVFLLTEGEW